VKVLRALGLENHIFKAVTEKTPVAPMNVSTDRQNRELDDDAPFEAGPAHGIASTRLPQDADHHKPGIPPFSAGEIAALLEEYAQNGVAPKLAVSVWDFAGQDVFMELHRLFLTPHGVYLVVFNVQELLLKVGQQLAGQPKANKVKANTRTTCLNYIRGWLNTIYMFAPGAPIVIVGTCLDKISRKQHQRDAAIAKVLDDVGTVVRDYPRPDDIQYTDDGDIRCCFLVDNINPTGPSVTALRQRLDRLLSEQKHVHETAPLSWLTVLKSLEMPSGSFEDAVSPR
jgi:GTPase SAR1 family protein